MQYSAINIQGNIISGEILEKIRIEDIKYQSAGDFGLDKNTTIRDEIGIAWAATRAHWSAFKLRRDRLKDSDTGTSETRQGWMIPFLRELGYDLEKSTSEIINGKTYAISHRAANRDGFPVHIVGINQSLDKRAEVGGTRLSPHALIQEYLNNHDHLYAMVTNGRFLRLLRDATRLSRLSYLEFDLERIMEEDQFAEFALLYRLLHVTRMPENQESDKEAVIEFYHQEALSSGSRIRENLSKAVEKSLKLLANGLLKHSANQELRDLTSTGKLKPGQYYLFLLRLVYRILFLMVIEERHLIYPEKRDLETNKKRDIYYRFYSINRLTKLAEKLIYVDPRKTDLWKSLLVTFKLFENSYYGEKLGLKPLGSGLFAPDALGNLAMQNLDNGTLLKVLQLLVTFENENMQRVRVNYADLDVEEFGSVYEGLLEYDPAITEIDGQPTFSFVKGEGRSSSGSHYTPEELVKPLIKHSLDYIIEERLKEPQKYISTQTQIGKRIFSPSQGEMSRSDRGVSTPENEKRLTQEQALLSITVCDVACGSGHILLSAARRIALELARVRTNEDQPTPPAIRQATRDAIRQCIYGVDLNPLAVELCKVALWLEAHNPGEPLNFLDHRIKCGNSIVGLAHKEELKNGIADEAFKTLPEDEKEVAATFRNKNKSERNLGTQATLNFVGVVEEPLAGILEKWEEVNNLPETTPEEIELKQAKYNQLISGPKWWKLKTLADMQVAQFFIPKTTKNKEYLVTDATYREYLNGQFTGSSQPMDMATEKAYQKKFFHWFLEFPEISVKGGFDCILGNPPYLGGKKISGNFGLYFLDAIHYYFLGVGGQSDLIAYFVRRIGQIGKNNSFFSIITTNTISEGDTRVGSIEHLISSKKYEINFAIKSTIWPGVANLYVALFSMYKGHFVVEKILNGKKATNINSYFLDEENNITPFNLLQNSNKLFRGVDFGGTGFIIDSKIREFFLSRNPNNKEVVSLLINGDEINNDPEQKASRWIINFRNYDFEKAKSYSQPFQHALEHVKPYRDEQNDNAAREKWWIYKRNKADLYDKIEKKKYCFVTAFTSKYLFYSKVETNRVYSNALNILSEDNFYFFTLLQSTLHFEWARKYGSKLKNDLRYTPTDCFETFPFTQNILKEQEDKLETIGETYHEHRRLLMLKMQLGLTKTYNAFHAPEIRVGIKTQDLESKTNIEITKKYDKEVWNLWNHLSKTEGACSWEEAIADIEELRRLHVEMDNVVLEAYNWHKDSEKWGKAIQLKHDFYEVEYLPENDRMRFTIHPNARKEVLKRLLLLNHERYEEEIKQGFHKRDDVEKFYEQKGQPVQGGVVFSDGKGSSKPTYKKAAPMEITPPAPKLFESHKEYAPKQEEPLKIASEPKPEQLTTGMKIEWKHSTKEFKFIIRNSAGQEFKYHVSPGAQRGKFTKSYKQILPNSPMADNVIGKNEGDTFEFGGVVYRILRIEV